MVPSSPMTAFVAQAREYCSSVERAAALPLPERLAVTRLRLLALYTAALDLPSVEPSDELACEHEPHIPTNWPGFGEHDAYLEIFDPYIDEPPVGGSLSDDVCDVYLDLRRGLWLWDAGRTDDAIWEWRFHFEHHWGDHAIDALRALHRACKAAT